MMHEETAVVIPYYRKELSETEKISLKQCFKVLSKYPIVLIIPDSMEEPICLYRNVIYEKVPPEWLQSVASYNQMMLNLKFYERLKEYKYILIYQLDAFVFSDQLKKFCQYGFDYIGAPWLKGVRHYKNLSRCVWHVGNGGFSLRKVETFIRILSNINLENSDVIEDVFWSSCEGEDFLVAPINIALQFSFECDVQACYELNDRQLPFGCHAWEKYDYDFWKPHIEGEGYKLLAGHKEGADTGRDYRCLELDCAIIRRSYEQYFRCRNKEIFIWGAGILGEECGWLLKKCGINTFRYVDGSGSKQGRRLWDILIEKPEALMMKPDKKHIVVIIAIKEGEKELLDTLESKGYRYMQNVFLYMSWIERLNENVVERIR